MTSRERRGRQIAGLPPGVVKVRLEGQSAARAMHLDTPGEGVTTYVPQQGMTLREACALAVAILGQPTAREVHQFLAGDGWPTTLMSVQQVLYHLRGGAVEVALRGAGRRADRWRLSEAGRAWVAGADRIYLTVDTGGMPPQEETPPHGQD